MEEEEKKEKYENNDSLNHESDSKSYSEKDDEYEEENNENQEVNKYEEESEEEQNNENQEVKESKENNQESKNQMNVNNQEIEKKQNSQIKWAIFLMIAVLLIILVVPFIMKNYIDKFNYKGLDFQKTKLGDLIFYSVKFPVISGTGEVIGDYAVNFRNNPRDLEYIDVNITNGTVKFARNFGRYGDVYISIDDKIIDCDDAIIAMASLSGFLGDSGLKIKSAVLNKTYAEENNETFINCWDSDVNTVIKVMPGNETRIREAKNNCYEIIYKDCEILQASEKFMIIVLEEYANRFIEK